MALLSFYNIYFLEVSERYELYIEREEASYWKPFEDLQHTVDKRAEQAQLADFLFY